MEVFKPLDEQIPTLDWKKVEARITLDPLDVRAKRKLVEVDVDKFDQAWAHSASMYLNPGYSGPNHRHGIRYDAYHDFLLYANDDTNPIYAATITIRPDGVPAFINGRHRYAVIRDSGATKIHVAMKKDDIKRAEKFGLLRAADTSTVTEALSIDVFNKDGSKKLPEVDIESLSKSAGEASFIYEKGKLRIFQGNHTMPELPEKDGVGGNINFRDNIISPKTPFGGMSTATGGGTPYNALIRQVRSVLEKETGKNFKVKFDGNDTDMVDLGSAKNLVLYHGTSSTAWENGDKPASKFGLSPGGPASTNWSGSGRALVSYQKAIYLTYDVDQARKYAAKAAEVQGGNEIVLKVTVPTDKLVPDDDYVYSLKSADRKSATWQDSLKVVGQVAYAGRIPASMIDIEERGKFEHKGKYKDVKGHASISAIQRLVKDALQKLEDLYADHNQPELSKSLRHSQITGKIKRLDDAKTVLDAIIDARSIFKMLGSDSVEIKKIIKTARSLSTESEAIKKGEAELQPFADVLEKHGYAKQSPDAMINDAMEDTKSSNDKTAEKAENALSAAESAHGNKNDMYMKASDLADRRFIWNRSVKDADLKLKNATPEEKMVMWDKYAQIMDDTEDALNSASIEVKESFVIDDDLLYESVNISKAFDSAGKKVWGGDTETSESIKKWLTARADQVIDNKAVVRFAKIVAKLDIKASREKILYDALIWANDYEKTTTEPSSIDSLIRASVDISHRDKGVRKNKKSKEESTKPVMQWSKSGFEYKVYKVSSSDVLFKMARWGGRMKPVKGSDPDDESSHDTNWCIRFPNTAKSYLSGGDALVIVKDDRAYVAMFDSKDQNDCVRFVDSGNNPVIEQPSLMKEIDPFIKKFHIPSMSDDAVENRLEKSNDPDDMLKIVSNTGKRVDRDIERSMVKRMDFDQIMDFADILVDKDILKNKESIDFIVGAAIKKDNAQGLMKFIKSLLKKGFEPSLFPDLEKSIAEDADLAWVVLSNAKEGGDLYDSATSKLIPIAKTSYPMWQVLKSVIKDSSDIPYSRNVVDEIAENFTPGNAVSYYIENYQHVGTSEKAYMANRFEPILKDFDIGKFLTYHTPFSSFSFKSDSGESLKSHLLKIMPSKWNNKTESMVFAEAALLTEGINVTKVFQTLGKKIWGGDDERRGRVMKWIEERSDRVRDNKAVIAFTKVTASLGLDTDNEKPLYDALIWADATNGSEPEPSGKAELRTKVAAIVDKKKEKQDYKKADDESGKPIMEWSSGRNKYRVYRVKTSDTLFKMARWGDAMKPRKGDDPEDEKRHHTKWCVRFPDYSAYYLEQGNALVVTRNGRAYVAMFDTKDQDNCTTFVTAQNKPVIENKAVMAELDPFLKKFHYKSMDKQDLDAKLKSIKSSSDLINYVGNIGERPDKDVEKKVMAKMTPMETLDYIMALANGPIHNWVNDDEFDTAVAKISQNFDALIKFLRWWGEYPNIPKNVEDKIGKDPLKAAKILSIVNRKDKEATKRLTEKWKKVILGTYLAWEEYYKSLPLGTIPEFSKAIVKDLLKNGDVLDISGAAMYYGAMYDSVSDPDRKYMQNSFAPYFTDPGNFKIYMDYANTYFQSVKDHHNSRKKMFEMIPEKWESLLPDRDAVYAYLEVKPYRMSSAALLKKLKNDDIAYVYKFAWDKDKNFPIDKQIYQSHISDDGLARHMFARGWAQTHDKPLPKYYDDDIRKKDPDLADNYRKWINESTNMIIDGQEIHGAQAATRPLVSALGRAGIETVSSGDVNGKVYVEIDDEYIQDVLKSNLPEGWSFSSWNGEIVNETSDHYNNGLRIERSGGWVGKLEALAVANAILMANDKKPISEVSKPRPCSDEPRPAFKSTFAIDESSGEITGAAKQAMLDAVEAVTTDVELDILTSGFHDVVTLSQINIPKGNRHEEFADKAIKAIVDVADAHGVMVTLGTAIEPLYRKNGFVPNKGKNKNCRIDEGYLRMPKKNHIDEARTFTPKKYYHGTDSVTAKKIAATGYIASGMAEKSHEDGIVSPIKGHTYLTLDLQEALLYAARAAVLNGVDEDPQCGLLVVYLHEIKGTIYPDEDDIYNFLDLHINRKSFAKAARKDGQLAINLSTADRVVSAVFSKNPEMSSEFKKLSENPDKDALHNLAKKVAVEIGDNHSSVMHALGNASSNVSINARVKVAEAYLFPDWAANVAKFNDGKKAIPIGKTSPKPSKTITENHDEVSDGKSVGYHCSGTQLYKHNHHAAQSFLFDQSYISEWGSRLLEILADDGDTEAKDLIDNEPENDQGQESEDWLEKAADKLGDSDIKWVFVSDEPDDGYGEHCYEVIFPKGTKLVSMTDYNHPSGSAYIYRGNVEPTFKLREPLDEMARTAWHKITAEFHIEDDDSITGYSLVHKGIFEDPKDMDKANKAISDMLRLGIRFKMSVIDGNENLAETDIEEVRNITFKLHSNKLIVNAEATFEDFKTYEEFPTKIIKAGTKLYHATEMKNIRSIKSRGFLSAHTLKRNRHGSVLGDKGTYFTFNEDEAWDFWDDNNNNLGAVLTVELTRDVKVIDVGKESGVGYAFRELKHKLAEKDVLKKEFGADGVYSFSYGITTGGHQVVLTEPPPVKVLFVKWVSGGEMKTAKWGENNSFESEPIDAKKHNERRFSQRAGIKATESLYNHGKNSIHEGAGSILPYISNKNIHSVNTLSERHSGAKQERGIWYHGTSSNHLASILKQGLITDPKKKSWSQDKDANSSNVNRTSYGGVYLTNQVMTAISSATRITRGNKNLNPIIVMCDMQPRSLVADEDDFASHLNSIATSSMSGNTTVAMYAYMAMEWGHKAASDEAKKSREEYVEKNLGWMTAKANKNAENGEKISKINPNDPLVKRLRKILEDGWWAVVKRMVSFFPSETGQYWKSDWKKAYLRTIHQEKIDDKFVPRPPDIQQAESDFRKFVEQVTKTLKSTARSKNAFRATGRSMDNIGYRGSNKIVCVVELVKRPDIAKYSDVVILRYGTIPDGFKSQYKAQVGSYVRIDDNDKVIDGKAIGSDDLANQSSSKLKQDTVKEASNGTIISPSDLGKIIKRAFRTDKAFEILDGASGKTCDWSSGGCWIASDAIVEILKATGNPAEVWVLVTDQPGREDVAQHFLVKSGSFFLDANGAKTEAATIKWWGKEPEFDEHALRLTPIGKAKVPSGYIHDAKSSKVLASMALKAAGYDDSIISDGFGYDDDEESLFQSVEDQRDVFRDTINKFLKNPDGHQLWTVVSSQKVKKIWDDYAKTGFVRNTRGINDIAKICIKNIWRISTNTIMAGHTNSDPLDNLEEEDFKPFTEEQFEKFVDYITDRKSNQMRISDYALNKLEQDALDLMRAKSSEDKLQIIDRIFNRIHLRSDIAEWFIDGGSTSLSQIAGIDDIGEATIESSNTTDDDFSEDPDKPGFFTWNPEGTDYNTAYVINKNVQGSVASVSVAKSPRELRRLLKSLKRLSDDTIDELMKKAKYPVNYLRKTEIPVSERGKGHGRELLKYRWKIAPGNSSILISARGKQETGVNLLDYYKRYGYRPVGNDSLAQAMIRTKPVG